MKEIELIADAAAELAAELAYIRAQEEQEGPTGAVADITAMIRAELDNGLPF